MPSLNFPTATTVGEQYLDWVWNGVGWDSLQTLPGGLPAGAIIQWGGSTAPVNWLLCDGSAVSRTTYASLFAAVGTSYGAGNGTTTFNLPDLRGRVPVGKNGGSFGTLGATGGAETVTLTESQMPSHTHIQNAHNHSTPMQMVSWPQNENSTEHINGDWGGWGWPRVYAINSVNNTTATNQNAGGGQAHNNLQPYQVVNYIIKATAAVTPGESELASRVGTLETTVPLKAPIASPSFTGTVTTSSQPAFLMYTNTGTAQHLGGWQNIALLPTSAGVATIASKYNIGNNFNLSNGRFTAPVTGQYMFYVGGWASYNGAGNRYAAAFLVNSGATNYITGANYSAADSPVAMSPIVLNLTAGDYVMLNMFSSVATTLGTGSHYFYYGGYFLG